MRRPASSFVLALSLVGLVSMGIGCGSGRDPNAPTRPLPAYAGASADLFDDTIDPAAVGLDFDKNYQARSDVVLRERTQVSDAVLRVRVQTVTSKKDGPGAVYQLGLQTIE